MAARRTNVTSPPSSTALTTLLGFSGSLTRSKTGGVFSEALACIFEGTGLHAGVVHEATPTGLELAAEEGLPAAFRSHIGSFPAADAPWFVVQHAAKRRRPIVEANAAAMVGARVPQSVLHNAGWDAIAAAPIVVGRDVLGVITLAAPSSELFTTQVLGVLETVANVLALFLAREKAVSGEAPHSVHPAVLTEVDEKLTRLATLGALAVGFAEDLRTVSTQLESFVTQQEKWLGQLRIRHPGAAPVLRELEPMQEEAASALMLARTSTGRLLAALEETSPEAIDVGAIVHDVVGLVESSARSQNIDILVAMQPGSEPLVRGKRSEIRQLVQGLILDGIEACGRADKPGKRVTPVPQMQLISVSVIREKTKVIVAIEHSGKVGSTEHRQTSSLHAPPSKEPLGLMLARNITVSHGGVLEAARSDLGGTLVRVVLPAVPAPPSSKRNRSGGASSMRMRPTIPAVEPPANTKRDGWTSTPDVISSERQPPIRTPVPTITSSSEPPVSDIDMYASTERVPKVLAHLTSPQVPASIVITDAEDAAKAANPASTKKRTN